MRYLTTLLRSTVVRTGFLVIALGLAVFAVVRERSSVAEALTRMDLVSVLVSVVLGAVYVGFTFLAWRSVLADLGSRLPVRTAGPLFVVSQLGKYVPGGVWNVVAAAELGSEHAIPRRRSLSAMAVAVLVSVVTGVAVAVLAVAIAPAQVRAAYGWVLWAAPVALVLLAPPVLNRVLGLAFRLMRREPLEEPLTTAGLSRAVGWSVASWLAAGLQVWVLGRAVGMDGTVSTLALSIGGYALAWVVGFLVVFVPAGLGAREVVLAALLAGQLDSGGVLTVVLLSRLVLTVVDVAAGVGGVALARQETRRRAHRLGGAPLGDPVGEDPGAPQP